MRNVSRYLENGVFISCNYRMEGTVTAPF